ncbi:MAG TPA: hypothetical protein VGG75_00285 [Trebonia sp.]
MIVKPTPGELLSGIHRELKAQVLPELPAGSAARQLRAALHALDLVARTWDLQLPCTEADNADLEQTLTELERISGLPRSPADRSWEPATGVTDPTLAAALARNLRLQSELEAFHHRWRTGGRAEPAVDRVLLGLHQRMTARAALASGVADE